MSTPITMKALLEAGVHFGHQTRRWNPKMKPYIFTERNGIYILDLQRTLREIDQAYRFVRDVTAKGGTILFVGTKKQAQEAVEVEASRSGQPYVNHRWLGGMLTNFVTIRKRVQRMNDLEAMEADGRMASLPKKEALKLRGQLVKLRQGLTGIREMSELPSAIFIIDTKREAIAVAEARRLNIPVIGIADTNSDPDDADYVIPGNDDAIRAITLLSRIMADAAAAGRIASGAPPVVEAEPRPVPEVVAAAPAEASAEAVEEAPAEAVEEAPAEAEPVAELVAEAETPAEAADEVPEAVAEPAAEPAAEPDVEADVATEAATEAVEEPEA